MLLCYGCGMEEDRLLLCRNATIGKFDRRYNFIEFPIALMYLRDLLWIIHTLACTDPSIIVQVETRE